jgi:LysM repeat protein
MIAITKQYVWVLVAVAVLSAPALIYYGMVQAQSFAPVSDTAPIEHTQSANRNADKSSLPTLDPAARLVVNPGDSLWSISQERLHPSATPKQIMNQLEQTFELNRDLIGDDPNLILPGQEILLPPVAELPAAAAPKVNEPEVAEQGPELISEPLVLSDLPKVEAVPEATEIAEFSFESYADKRQMLGLVITALTLVIAILMTRILSRRRNIEDSTAWRISRGYHENNAPFEPARRLRGESKSALEPLMNIGGSNNFEDKNSTDGHGSNPVRTNDAKVTPHRFRTTLPSTTVFKEADDVSRGGTGSAASTMLSLMAEGKDYDKDYYTPPQAARILRLSRQRVTQMLQSGEMEGKQDPQSGRWKIPQRVVHSRLKERPARARIEDLSSQDEPERSQRLIELELEVRDLSYRLGRSEAHLELTERTESTVRAERERLLEDLERERRRADRLESELQDARRPWWRKMLRE